MLFCSFKKKKKKEKKRKEKKRKKKGGGGGEGLTLKIRMLCFVIINNVLFNFYVFETACLSQSLQRGIQCPPG